MSFTAKDVCNKAITIESTKTMDKVRDTLLKRNISRVIITQNKKPIGMVTEKGISRYLYWSNNTNDPLNKITISKAMRTPLISVTRDTSIDVCVKLMLDHDISSLIVNEEGGGMERERRKDDVNEINLFTKSDLIKLYSQNYKGKHLVSDFMTRLVFTTHPSNSIHTVLRILMKNRISRVIVVSDDDDKEIVGIITSKDLMPITAFVEGDKLYKGKRENVENDINDLVAIGHAMIARDLMKKPIVIKSDEDLADAAKIMTDRRISGIPVVSPHNDNSGGSLVGMITKTDITKALIE